MAEVPTLSLPENPKLVANITHFARALRKAGLNVGTGRVMDAVKAVAAVGFTSRRDFYWTLHACFVSRPEERAVFAQVFRLYWRDPRFLEHMMAAMLPAIRGVQEERIAKPAEKRAAEALLQGQLPDDLPQDAPEGEEIEIDATMTLSAEERLKTLDFEQMSTDEIAKAKRMLACLTLPIKPLKTRRHLPSPQGARADWRRTMRGACRTGGEIHRIARTRRAERFPNLVVLCDISGSMSQYSRMVLHFLHALTNAREAHRRGRWAQVHGFTFGTRLTNITRHLRQRDVDAALAAAGAEAQDWQGGTRIGACLHAFNRDWSRRVMGQGAVVVLVSDGLDREHPVDLAREMQRLQRSAKRLIWLNPLLRWDGFAPRAQGIQAMLPHVDSFRAGHNIASLEDLASVLSRPEDTGEKARLMALMQGTEAQEFLS
ncbi:vWA domain-containing protein [Tritonibacter mobilis]|uniref:vWA domain-containing protein n=1 Tax=Tritonibacter mobilis TaxID=379347 RepID=UPI001403B5A1|nr:VWA domain-containing protein [Tritonibacter mobilis]NHM17362.1 VWA domain-containing protein [Tritonibacter mobilis]NHM21550.1 VWA domain-containing protein [Tritonibacter mobilis]